ncbi:OsmC family protein [Streptomyces misionensis]|uniref:OsmC family protein n=1 Tax=Streptomyces misionensis TaxID=67331 RepID=UPI0033E8EB72
MRNSFNTASFSEVVHEIREDASEGLFRYVGKAYYSPLRGLTAEVGPAMLGSVKSARRFSFDIRNPFAPITEFTAAEPTPMDLALTGIGSCSLMTFIGGGSAQGLVFESVEVGLTCGPDDETPTSIEFEVEGEVEGARITELIRRVRQRSPNYASLAAAVPVEWWCLTNVATPSERRRSAPRKPPTAVQAQPDRRRIRWLSGPQSESFARPPSGAASLRVDNPKQLTGVDWGPNPQEYLMMGFAAEVAAYLGAHSRDRLGRDAVWEATARCTEDVSGLLRADPDAVVHLQDVSCAVSMSSPCAPHESVEELVGEAVSGSRIGRLISEPQVVEISSRAASSPSAG